jgi:hypothetical protein
MCAASMSYYLSLRKAKFSIPVARAEDALNAVEKRCPEIVESTLEEVFDSVAWSLRKQAGHWVMVESEDVKQGWQDELFASVAPFVVDGSFIKARGEDGELFEWHFIGGAVHDAPAPPVLVGRVQLVVPVAKLRDAFVALESQLPKLLAKLDDPPSVTAVFDRLGWKTTRGKDGTLEVGRKAGDDKPLTERDRRVLKALAPFVTAESFVEGREGGWRFVFERGRLVER